MAARPILRSGVRYAAFACLAALGACSDGSSAGPVDPVVRTPLPAGSAVQAVRCQADVRAATVDCRPWEPGAPAGVSLVSTIGGQGINVRVANTNVQYDSTLQIFSTNVTVQNLLVQRMGTKDGTAVSGVTIFFHSGPDVAVGGPGSVDVRNEDGNGFFLTGEAQPYFHWPEVLPLNAVSAARRWEFGVPPAVTRFTFVVYIRTELLPVVVFDRSAGGNRDIWRVALDGNDLVRLTTNTADDRNPTVGGGRVVFTTYRHGLAELYAVPLAGGAETRITTTATFSETDPALSLDGTRLAFLRDSAGGAKVWRANADGSGAVRATPDAFGFSASPEAGPAWGPQGDRLALVGTSGGSADVFQMLGDGMPQVLAASSFAEITPGYSADGKLLAYATDATGGGDVYMLSLETGGVTRLTSDAETEFDPSFTQDGRVVYLRTFTGGSEIRWLNPAVPGGGGVVPLPTGNRPDRPYVVAF